MKFGVKTYDSEKFLDFFIDKADFFEVQAVCNNDYSFMKKYIGRKPIVIHAEHSLWEINYADSSKYNLNLDSINFAIKLADELNSEKIVVHLGYLENEFCSLQNCINFLKSIKDTRILIENVPLEFYKNNNIKNLGTTPSEISKVMKLTNKKFCFDLNHAIKSALENNKFPYSFFEGFLKLNPLHFHLSGQDLKTGKDHLHFSEGNLNKNIIINFLSKVDNPEITLEVDFRNKLEIVKDLKFLK
jgi:uncharacterized protein (UPF0276 family)